MKRLCLLTVEVETGAMVGGVEMEEKVVMVEMVGKVPVEEMEAMEEMEEWEVMGERGELVEMLGLEEIVSSKQLILDC